MHELQKDYLQCLYGFHQIKTFRDRAGVFQGIIQGIDEQGRLIVDRAQQARIHYNNQEIALIL
jgi:biotin-(acetyl-CoA carboxylase) ligase